LLACSKPRRTDRLVVGRNVTLTLAEELVMASDAMSCELEKSRQLLSESGETQLY
jgi:hypothetical protein